MNDKDPKIQSLVDQFIRIRSLSFALLNESNRVFEERLYEYIGDAVKTSLVVKHSVRVNGVVYCASESEIDTPEPPDDQP